MIILPRAGRSLCVDDLRTKFRKMTAKKNTKCECAHGRPVIILLTSVTTKFETVSFRFSFYSLCLVHWSRLSLRALWGGAVLTLGQTTTSTQPHKWTEKKKKRNSNSHNDHWKHVRNYSACFALSVFALIHFQFEAQTNVTIQFLACKRNHISFSYTHTGECGGDGGSLVRWNPKSPNTNRSTE